jgi:hypothetical protein
MRARFKTTAGAHWVGATFPATNFAPVLDLDQHFMRDTVQTGPTPGFTFFPHVGTIRIEGPFNAAPAKESPSRARIFVCRPPDLPTCRQQGRPSTSRDEKPLAPDGLPRTSRPAHSGAPRPPAMSRR